MVLGSFMLGTGGLGIITTSDDVSWVTNGPFPYWDGIVGGGVGGGEGNGVGGGEGGGVG